MGMSDFRTQRARMLREDIEGRGIKDPTVLRALREVPREDFVPEALAESAYEDGPLPIGEGQTISQPYVVALTLEALALPPRGARVLEVGAGSGYSAALLSRLARDVYTVERVGALAKVAKERLARLGYHNVHVRHGDGTLGWRENAPYDGIAVAAGGPHVPRALLEQLAIGGRLVMPVGSEEGEGQTLLRVTRKGPSEYEHEPLGDVAFVPLIGAHAWSERAARESNVRQVRRDGVATLLREVGERLDDIDDADVGAILERIGDAKVVLLGASTYGTSEFYRLRARITRELVLRRGFGFVAVEADERDAARVDDYVRGRPPRDAETPFTRFPAWTWRNREASALIEWLRAHNAERGAAVGFHGLDARMFETLRALLSSYGPDAKAVVWAHNTHVGDARATERGERAQRNLGHLCRITFGDAAYAIGFGTDHGTVAAACGWDQPVETMRVRPSHPASYERLFHDSGVAAMTVALRDPVRRALREELMDERLERAIGVVYSPRTELETHYFKACLPRQVDEWIWIDETHAVEPLPKAPARSGEPSERLPFGV
jgi:protein-L-isoaspartate(D-aspartate) O-methyltransferase